MGKAMSARIVIVGLLGTALLLAGAAPAAPQGVPVGKARTPAELAADVEQLLFDRRIHTSDLTTPLPRVAFKVAACMKCHENRPGVEGQTFYGPAFKDYAKDQKTENRSIPAKRLAAGRDYDFVKTHTKHQKLWVGEVHEQVLKRNW